MKGQGNFECLNIEGWRAASKREVVAWLQRDKKTRRQRESSLVVRTQLKPVDAFCYLKARFGAQWISEFSAEERQ